ncbi:hypothetical protein Taro_041706 [Colocasia esculenta]|uniref:Peptidase S8/S53 domain-containing protein n=1 Tax=Colocasia esculenta TaxID=4460 RepID=A0A843WMG1_COLES|nr:hypothetical protein [Colocasia esculenta]
MNQCFCGGRECPKKIEQATLSPTSIPRPVSLLKSHGGTAPSPSLTANLLGYASGTARSMATCARIAVYKVYEIGGCFSSNILSTLDKAVDDSINVLSLSLGGGQFVYFWDGIAIGAFAAMEKGILVSCFTGNAGPGTASLSNVAPWITTVGAGTIDCDFPTYIPLGNDMNYMGVSLYSGKPLPDDKLPFVYTGNVTNSTNENLCMSGTLILEKVADKILHVKFLLMDEATSEQDIAGVVHEMGLLPQVLHVVVDVEAFFPLESSYTLLALSMHMQSSGSPSWMLHIPQGVEAIVHLIAAIVWKLKDSVEVLLDPRPYPPQPRCPLEQKYLQVAPHVHNMMLRFLPTRRSQPSFMPDSRESSGNQIKLCHAGAPLPGADHHEVGAVQEPEDRASVTLPLRDDESEPKGI